MVSLHYLLLDKLECAHKTKRYAAQVPLYTALAQCYERQAQSEHYKRTDYFLKAASCYHFAFGANKQSTVPISQRVLQQALLVQALCMLEENLVDSFGYAEASIRVRNIERLSLFWGNRKQLNRLRHQTERQLEAHLPIRQIMKALNNESLPNFFRALLQQCIQVLGKPPCRYAVIAFGSLARYEATPYSDFEWGILLQEGQDSKENVWYFECLAYYMNLKILNLGETSPKIEYLTQDDEITPLFPEFFDYSKNPVKKGLALDSKDPSGCKSPLGNMHLKGQKVSFRLIQTPSKMAAFYNETNFELYPSLPLIIRTVRFLEGDQDIVVAYKDKINLALRKEFLQKQAVAILRRDIARFEPRVGRVTGEGRAYLVKYELYRLPNMILDGLALFYQLSHTTSFGRIKALIKPDQLNQQAGHVLQNIMDQACEVRLRHYFKAAQQDDELYDLPPEVADSLYENLFYLLDSAYDFCLGAGFDSFNHVNQEQHMTQIRVAEKRGDFLTALTKIEETLTQHPWTFSAKVGFYHYKGRVLAKMGKFTEAEAAYKEGIRLAKDNKAPALALVSLCDLLNISSIRDHHQVTKQLIKAIETTLQNALNPRTVTEPIREAAIEHRAVAQCITHVYRAVGCALTRLREYKSAKKCLQRAIDQELQLYPDDANPTLIQFRADLVNACSGLGQFEEAIELAKSNLNAAKKWYGESHPQIGGLYYNLGGALLEQLSIHSVKHIMRRYVPQVEEAKQSCEKALAFHNLSKEINLLCRHKLAVCKYYDISRSFGAQKKYAAICSHTKTLQEELDAIIEESNQLSAANVIAVECWELKGAIYTGMMEGSVLYKRTHQQWDERYGVFFTAGCKAFQKALEIAQSLSNPILSVCALHGIITLHDRYIGLAQYFQKKFPRTLPDLSKKVQEARVQRMFYAKECKASIEANQLSHHESPGISNLAKITPAQCSPSNRHRV